MKLDPKPKNPRTLELLTARDQKIICPPAVAVGALQHLVSESAAELGWRVHHLGFEASGMVPKQDLGV